MSPFGTFEKSVSGLIKVSLPPVCRRQGPNDGLRWTEHNKGGDVRGQRRKGPVGLGELVGCRRIRVFYIKRALTKPHLDI